MNVLEMHMSIADTLSISLTGIIVVMIILAMLAVIVMGLSKVVRVLEGKTKKSVTKKDAAAAPANDAAAPDAQPANDSVALYKTDEKTAAVIMAIVSEECGIPLNKLKFNSIRLIEK